jgi:hypothetical protein
VVVKFAAAGLTLVDSGKPTFDDATGEVVVPTQTGVSYRHVPTPARW